MKDGVSGKYSDGSCRPEADSGERNGECRSVVLSDSVPGHHLKTKHLTKFGVGFHSI
jgi:hypothetical protein